MTTATVTQTLDPFEKEVMMIETAITLPEKCPPVRIPTKYSAEPTLVYGPNPNATTHVAYPSGISGTSVLFPNEIVHVVPNHPFLTEVYHVPVVGQRSAYLWRMRNIGVAVETLTRAGAGSISMSSSSDKVEFIDARPADASQGSPTDQLALHGPKQVAFQALGRRGIYLDQYSVAAVKCLVASLGLVFTTWYRWLGNTWQVVTPEALSITVATGGTTYWQPLDAGIYSLDLSTANSGTFAIWVSNDSLVSPTTVGRMLWSTSSVGQYNAVMAMRMFSGLLTQWGAFEKIRLNCLSQRLTSVSNDYAQGGTIEQAQVPAGDDIADVLDALMNVFYDATSYVQTLPGRRYEPNRKGSNAPMTPDGPKYWDYRSCVRVDGNGVVQDNWISLDEPMTCLICAVTTAVPPAGTAAPQFVSTVNGHVEAYASNKLLERNRPLITAAALDRAVDHLAGLYLVTENPDHVADILANLWDSIRGGIGTIGKSIITAGATMGPLAPVAFGVGGAMTGASMLSSGMIRNAFGMKASTGARLAPQAVERVIQATSVRTKKATKKPQPQPEKIYEVPASRLLPARRAAAHGGRSVIVEQLPREPRKAKKGGRVVFRR